MVKIVLLLDRRPDLSQEAFQRYWRERHAPLVRQVPELRRYVISVRTRSLAGEPQPDGVAELWFDDAEALERALRSPEWAAARADGSNFRTNSVAFVTHEEEMFVRTP